MINLKDIYAKTAIPALKAEFGYTNSMAVPRVVKVVLNTSFGKASVTKTNDEQKKIAEAVLEDISRIAGQRAALTRAKKSIATFKLRQGMAIGAKVTLRGQRAYHFLDRLIHVVLPRSRDFRGIRPESVDNKGNISIGIKEHMFFPEISPEKIRFPFGLEITVETTAQSKTEGLALFRALGFPFASS
ncbi:MAG: 50S ribosomal protein L5 [Candidatus Wildermuthbacteria bacterium]|nr:50S ribosomal protein L5 [Candidatus Wildermuthbacteria bacterium]